jgi:transcriptional regulator with XRE-family HTH domain
MAKANGRPGGATRREQEMRELLELRDGAGLTVRELSEASGVPAGTLAWWSGELRRRDAMRIRAAAPDFVEVVLEAGVQDEPEDRDDLHAAPCFEVDLGGGCRVRVPQSYGLVRLVRELRAC